MKDPNLTNYLNAFNDIFTSKEQSSALILRYSDIIKLLGIQNEIDKVSESNDKLYLLFAQVNKKKTKIFFL